MLARNIIETYLSSSVAKQFAEWAIGKHFEDRASYQWPALWNDLHGNELILLDVGHPDEDIPKMIQIWKKIKD